MKRNIVLCGFMASGKTSVGKEISLRTGMPFVDTDSLIEEREEMDIPSIFRFKGEPHFRRVEKEVVRNVSVLEGAVIAVGGGAVLDPENVGLLKEKGRLYLLEVSPAEAVRRLPGDGSRPLVHGKTEAQVSALMRSRAVAYRAAADVVVNTDGKSVEEVAAEIIAEFGGGKEGLGAD